MIFLGTSTGLLRVIIWAFLYEDIVALVRPLTRTKVSMKTCAYLLLDWDDQVDQSPDDYGQE